MAASGSGQTWTVMLYQEADDQILEKDIFVDLNEAERVGSSDRVKIVAQMDRFAGAYQGDANWTGARRYYVTQENDLNAIHSQVAQELGEVDMADGRSLVNFVQWAVANFPADKYVLILVDGIYTFASSGESVNAQLYFQNGKLVQVFGITGEGETGAPREITPQVNDTVTVLEKWFERTSSGGTQIVYENGETLTFGTSPFTWEQLYAAQGEYVVGFIIEDLDGKQYPVYTQITVQ